MEGQWMFWVYILCILLIQEIDGSLGDFTPQYLQCAELSTPVPNVKSIPDNLKIGEAILTINNLTGIDTNDCDQKDFLQPNGTSVTLKEPLKTICTKSIRCSFTCQQASKNVSMLVIINIDRALAYNIAVTPYTYTEVHEMAPSGIHLTLNNTIQPIFSDCRNGTRFSPTDFTAIMTLEKNGGGLFVWTTSTNFDSLEVDGTIDYEAHTEFDLLLNVSFRGINASNTTDIHVTVIDVDDNDPRFNTSGAVEYTLNIPEGDTSLVNVSLSTTPAIYAYDPDFGINQELQYSIVHQETNDLFYIDSKTGKLSVTKPLDREQTDTYRLIIQAAQTDNPSKAARATVRVNVTDIDDHLPVFNPENYAQEVMEHAASGTYVTRLTVIDPDEGANANFTCVMFNTSLPLEITDVPNGCLIRVSNSDKLDREAYKGGEIIFQVGAKATLRDEYGTKNATVTVKLHDINDNTPVFTDKSYSFSLTDATDGSSIGSVSAEDPDEGGNGNVTYTVTSSIVQTQNCDGSVSSLPFKIDLVTGHVSKTSEPNCDFYKTGIEACDNPTPSANRRCSFAELVVTTNNTMELRNFSQELHITENSPTGSYVDQLKCHGNGYRYVSDSHYFHIDTSGFLKTSAVLDRENTSIYSLQVHVEDQTLKVVCNLNVTVKVRDVNDNAPEFGQSEYMFTMPDNAVDGQLIGIVKAEDQDDGVNADINYHFQKVVESRFKVNSTTGEIGINSVTMVAACDVIGLGVIARDGGNPAMESFAQVYVICHTNQSEVPISTPLMKDDVEKRKQALERDISHILNMTVIVTGVTEIQGSKTERTRVLLSTKGPEVTQQRFLQAILLHYEAIKALFYSAPDRMSEPDTSGNKFGAAEIALIAMGVVILIGTIVAIVIINKQFNSQKRYKQLYESLTRNSSLYESQEINMKMDDETTDCNGFVKSQDLGSMDSQTNPNLAVSAVNPGFVDDEETTVKQTNLDMDTNTTSNTSVKDVIESLDRLSDRLAEEEVEHVPSDVLEHSTTDDEAPLVQTEPENDIGDGEFAPAVYANVEMNNAGNSDGDDCVDIDMPFKARNSLEIPRSENIALHRMDVEADVNQTERDSENKEDGVNLGEDEPNPDYNVKQVRFSGEVLDADENILQPLKLDKDDANSEEESREEATEDPEQITETEDDIEPLEQVEPGWLEEEIESPRNTVTETDSGKEFFFCEDAQTHF